MRKPTTEERAQERSFFYTTLADTAITVLFIVFAITTGSLTLLSEAIRGALMVTIQFYALWVLLALHRRRLDRFQYGVGKLEQFVWGIIGLGLALSGLWVGRTVIDTIFTGGSAASPLGLAWAASVNAVNTVINVIGWLAMMSAARAGQSDVFQAQLRARFTVMASSLFVQGTLTAGALARDDVVGVFLDAIGATFVAGVMLYSGLTMIAQALPSLLDTPASTALETLIRETAASVVSADDIASVRTRRSGRQTFAEVAVTSSAFVLPRDISVCTIAISDALRRKAANVELTLVVAPEQAEESCNHPQSSEDVDQTALGHVDPDTSSAHI